MKNDELYYLVPQLIFSNRQVTLSTLFKNVIINKINIVVELKKWCNKYEVIYKLQNNYVISL